LPGSSIIVGPTGREQVLDTTGLRLTILVLLATICVMRRVPPGPERDALLERAERRHQLMEAAVRAAPFPVIGLAGEVPSPLALGGAEMSGETLTRVTLTYGFEQQQPLVIVRTALVEAGNRGGFARSSTEELEHWNGPESDDALPQIREAEETEVTVEEQRVRASYRTGRRAWSLQFRIELDAAVLDVLVISRDRTLAGQHLERVRDVEPFIAGGRALRNALRHQAELRREPEPEEWDLPPAEGLAAHEELIRSALEHSRAFGAAGGVAPRRPPDPERPRRWEAATRAQMALAGEDRTAATDAVHRLVNHLTRLNDSADWFEDGALAEVTIAECIDHEALHHEVSSHEAQHAWARYWAVQMRPRPRPNPGEPPAQTPEEMRAEFEERAEAESAWRAAWLRWVTARR
jgi:hypothetical protein